MSLSGRAAGMFRRFLLNIWSPKKAPNMKSELPPNMQTSREEKELATDENSSCLSGFFGRGKMFPYANTQEHIQRYIHVQFWVLAITVKLNLPGCLELPRGNETENSKDYDYFLKGLYEFYKSSWQRNEINSDSPGTGTSASTRGMVPRK